jgi:hypothetical protein
MRRGSVSEADLKTEQIELPLRVTVCAWCKPDARQGMDVGLISHGICPRHLKKLKLSLNQLASKAPIPPRRRSRRKRQREGEPLLPLQFST